MSRFILIFVGSGLGGILRYSLQGWLHRRSGAFPWGTFVVNVSGCALLGFLAAALAEPLQMREEYRLGLTVGLVGGFTTFSTFGLETFNLAQRGEWRWALLNVALSCAVGLAAVWFGYRAGEELL